MRFESLQTISKYNFICSFRSDRVIYINNFEYRVFLLQLDIRLISYFTFTLTI